MFIGYSSKLRWMFHKQYASGDYTVVQCIMLHVQFGKYSTTTVALSHHRCTSVYICDMIGYSSKLRWMFHKLYASGNYTVGLLLVNVSCYMYNLESIQQQQQ